MTADPVRSAAAGPAAGDADLRAMLLGLVGVAIFSVTLPATRAALEGFDALFVSLGRVVLAALPAAALLALRREAWPSRDQAGLYALAVGGVILGFPVCSALAMQYVPASHGGVVLGILPLATAAAGALIAGERPSLAFWGVALLGSAVVVAFALRQGGGALHWADALLLAAVAAAGLGYAACGRLARRVDGTVVICWAIVLSLPVVVPLLLAHMLRAAPPRFDVPATAWAGFLYVAFFSQFLGFFAWNRGLALGGIARVGQVQLLQTFMTLGFAALLLGEHIDAVTLGAAALVVALVALGRRLPVARRAAPAAPTGR